jgi:hypothetical protein
MNMRRPKTHLFLQCIDFGDDFSCEKVARLTGLEPATPGVTGRYSNQLSYNRASLPFQAAPKDNVSKEKWRG